MRHYAAYGLCIDSELLLPELPETDSAPDVRLRLDSFDWPPARDRHFAALVRDDEVRVRYEGVGAFRVRCGREIAVDPLPGVDEATLRHYVLGRGLAILLYQRGAVLLHASAVALGPQGVVFLGDRGRGKSTLAAALWQRGHDLLTDDIAALCLRNGEVWALPSFPRMRFAGEATAGESADLERKRVVRIERGFSPEPVRLAQIYELDEGPEPAVDRLSPRAAFAALSAHRFLDRELLGPAATRNRFLGLVEIARRIQVSRLSYPRELERLPEVAAAIERG